MVDLLAPSFPDVTVIRRDGTARFASVDDWIHTDVRGWTLSGMIDDPTFDRLLELAPARLRGFVDDDGAVAFPAPALIAVGTRPASA